MFKHEPAPKILVAESDEIFLRAFVRRLEEEGMEVSVIKDGSKLVTRLANFRPDLLVIASILPSRDGLSILKDLRKQETLEKIPVIILSTLGTEDEELEANKLCIRQFIVKSQHLLSEIVQRVVVEAKSVVQS